MPGVTLTAPVLGTADPRGLARFYQRLLGWPLRDDPASVQGPAPSLRGVGGTEVLSHVPPVWPPEPGTQAGARPPNADTEPHEDVRTYADLAGHPFSLFVRT
jgi:hypothetical protein